MRGLRLRKVAVRLLLGGMHEIRELDGILNEENGDVVAHQIPVALAGIELDGKAAYVAHHIGRALVARHGGKPHEGGRALAHPVEDIGLAHIGQAVSQFKIAMRAVATGVHHALGDALMVEMEDLFTEMEVLHQGRTTRACTQGILVI